MNLAEAKAGGLKNKATKRLGRGTGSGLGKTSGKGHKGARARSGYSRRIVGEGGQMPLFRRIPKRGFNNKNFKKFYTIINVDELGEAFEAGTTVDLEAVLTKGLASRAKHSNLFKVLGNGDLKVALTVRADAVTESARQKIEAAGGKVELIPAVQHRPKFVRKGQTEPTPKKRPAPPKGAASKA